MTLSIVLEVGLGLMLVYYVLGLIVSYITSEIVKWTELRAKDLEEGLRELLEDTGKLQEFLDHPLIKNLEPKRLLFLQNETRSHKVESIPSLTFALVLFDVLTSGGKSDDLLEDIKDAVNALPESETKRTLTSLLGLDVDNMRKARELVENWYDDAMKNVGLLYKQHARRIVVAVALVVTVVTGTDSVAIANSLWQEPALRAAAVTRIDQFLQQEPEGNVQELLGQLTELRIPLFWNSQPLPTDAIGWAWKLIGLLSTWIAAAQGSSFWYDMLKRFKAGPSIPAPTVRAQA